MLKRVGQFVAAAAALAASTSAPSAAEARPLRIRPMWGDEGHQITALVAMQLLNAQANSTVAQVLGGQTLMEVSTWADSVKHTPGYEWSASYHFVDTPDWACTYQETYCKDACVVDAINNYTKRATTQTGQQQNEAVKFITHFVGDAHQPLHVAFASDRGGNDITGTYTGAGQSLSTNLHAVWDFCILEQRMNGDFGGSVEQYAAYLLKQISGPWASQAAQWAACQSGSFPCPDEWAAQTAQFGCNYGYTDQDGNHIASGFNLGDAYYAFTSGIVDQQLATGGVRLGALINSIYGSSSSAAEAKRD